MTGTRVDVLSKFMAWIKDEPAAIFWLAGMAGTGKNIDRSLSLPNARSFTLMRSLEPRRKMLLS